MSNCARIGRPEGGPRDSAPPVLLKTIPKYGAIDFKKKRVRLSFNEYVVLKDQSKNFIMSPPPEKIPSLMIRGKGVVVEFNSPLKDSTTYLLNFGNAIVDNNEGNLFANYRFAFSTGGVVDSMRMTGLALDAATGEPLSGATICLYASTADSAVLTQRPLSVARSDKWGFFVFEHIKPIPYRAVLLTDENRNYKYDAGSEAIGFFDGTINPVDLYPPQQWLVDTLLVADTGNQREPQFILRSFTEDVKKQYLITAQRTQRKAFTMIFNAPFPRIDSVEASGVDLQKITIEYSAKHDTTTFWLRDTAQSLPDSLRLNFRYLKHDTLGNLTWERQQQKLFFDAKKEADKQALAMEKEKSKKGGGIGGFFKSIVGISDSDTTPRKPAHWTLKPSLAANISPITLPVLGFETLLFATNPARITIEEMRVHPKTKDTTYVALRFTLKQDTLRLRRYTLAASWKDGGTYRYSILPDAFTDIYGQTNDTIAGVINVMKSEQAATLAFKCTNTTESLQYIVQIMDSKGSGVLYEQIVDGDSVKPQFTYLAPASYRVRIVKDENRNGKWDAGNYFQHRQPEYAVFLKNTDGTVLFPLKANWEQELSVNMKILFPAERLRSKEMDFPFTDILTESVEYITFCAQEKEKNTSNTPQSSVETEEWLLFCEDAPSPEMFTEDEEWTEFCNEDDFGVTKTLSTEYVEFCVDALSEENTPPTSEDVVEVVEVVEYEEGLCEE
jgi:hypothetical protein